MTTPQTTQKASPTGLPAGRWRIVPDRSRVGFEVRKMGFWPVRGRFERFSGEVRVAPSSETRAELTIAADSVTTRMPPRDWHLRTRDFLDAKRHPQIRIEADGIEPLDERTMRVHATLEVKRNARPVELKATRLDTGGDDRLRLRLEGTLDRHELGIRPRRPFEMIVGHEVRLDVELVAE